MSEVIIISPNEVIHQVKLSCLVPSVIEGILTRKVISRIAQEQGIEADPAELQQSADGVRLFNNLQSAHETWLWLQKHSLSLDEFEELVRLTVISSKLATHLFADKIQPFFIEHQLDYAQVVMYEVVLEDEDLVLELFYAIQAGETTFHEVARQYIQDNELRRMGGYRGMLYRKDLKPEVSAAVFAATPPQILKPVMTSKGAHLILIEEIIKPELNEALRYKILSELFTDWLKKETEQLDILVQLDSLSTSSQECLVTRKEALHNGILPSP